MRRMSTTTWGIGVLVLAVGIPCLGWGLEDAALTNITLSGCIRIAMAHNVDIQNAREGLKTAESNFRSAKAEFIPMVDLSGRRSHVNFSQDERADIEDQLTASFSQKIFTGGEVSLNGQLDRSEGQRSGVEEYGSDVNAEFRQPFLRGGGLWAPLVSLRQSRHALLREQMSLRLQEQQLILDVTSGYYGVLRAVQFIKVQERALEGARNSHRASVINFKVDRVAEIDTLQARLEVSTAENELIQAQEDLIRAKENLLLLMGLEMGRDLELAEEGNVEQIEFVPYEVDLDEAVQTAMEHRLELKQLNLQLEDGRLSILAARDAKESRFDLFLNYGMSMDGDSFDAVMELTDPVWTFGFDFQVPLWKVRERQAYTRTVIQHRRLQRTAVYQKRAIIKEVREVVRSLQTSQNQLRVLEQALALARETYELRGMSYERGYSTITDFLQAQQQLTRTEQSYYSALMSHKTNLVRLRKVMGTLEITTVEEGLEEYGDAGKTE